MQRRVELQPAWLLHSRPFRDTSQLLDFLTRDHGRVSMVAKGIRRPGSRLRGIVQMFTPLQISFTGQRDLKTLIQAEVLAYAPMLKGLQLITALYMNELLTRLIHSHESDPALFDAYGDTLAAIREGKALEPLLRRFEVMLLESVGYGLSFDSDAETGMPVEADGWYHYEPEQGFFRINDPGSSNPAGQQRFICGRTLQSLAVGHFSDAESLQGAKRLMRRILNDFLGDRPLQSRQLFPR